MKRTFHLPRFLHQFARDVRGVAAVEFAVVLPLMMTMYLGGSEVSQGISASRKVTLVSRTVADLSSQVSNITNASMTNILNASATIVAPFPAANLKVTVSCVNIDATGKATIAWSDTLGGTTHSVGSTVTLPPALNVANTSLVWSEVQYSYKPTIGYVISGTLTLKDQMYMRPRLSDTITRSVS
jgi:Flp pilus assembly protein TadG